MISIGLDLLCVSLRFRKKNNKNAMFYYVCRTFIKVIPQRLCCAFLKPEIIMSTKLTKWFFHSLCFFFFLYQPFLSGLRLMLASVHSCWTLWNGGLRTRLTIY
ncbi:unnamed protein product [Eruca vesicaria subsp. sativa]|uniref:Uncharacterized protein n=1 Tax=Eruca vesicaria subsp. sativa TaxID=29727 RepID=A0ABC8IYJ3_ERUVS|nr:unnamed protein product [Eruca vesicaria subsp. sativa]